jgi:DNA-binding MarR family transcriptional regulator
MRVTAMGRIPLSTTHEVRDACLCLHVQRAARALARRFDDAFRPLGISHGQFSLLMALNGPEAPPMGRVAELLAMDRTTLTANLKPLERRGLVEVRSDAPDRRVRRLLLTDAGRQLLVAAVPIWREQHRVVETGLPSADGDALRRDLLVLSANR